MPEVISFPNDSADKLRICQDAVDALEIAFRRIRAVIELSSEGPTKSLLRKKQQLLQTALDEAKTKIKEVCANHLPKHPNP